MSNTIAVILGGVLLPKHGRIKELTTPNETENITLGGRRYTDFINVLKGWQLSWDVIKTTDYEIMADLFMEQYQNEAYHMLQIDAKGVYQPVKMEITDTNYKLNGVIVENFSITLKYENAIS